MDIDAVMKRGGNRKKEKPLSDKIIRHVNSLPGGIAWKRYAGTGNKGKPDITGAIGGRRLEIETKKGANRPTDKQQQWLDRFQQAGCIAGWVSSMDEYHDLLKRFGIN